MFVVLFVSSFLRLSVTRKRRGAILYCDRLLGVVHFWLFLCLLPS